MVFFLALLFDKIVPEFSIFHRSIFSLFLNVTVCFILTNIIPKALLPYSACQWNYMQEESHKFLTTKCQDCLQDAYFTQPIIFFLYFKTKIMIIHQYLIVHITKLLLQSFSFLIFSPFFFTAHSKDFISKLRTQLWHGFCLVLEFSIVLSNL